MRLRNYVLVMLAFSVAVIAASLASLAVTFLSASPRHDVALPPWTLGVLMFTVLFPVSFHFWLRAKKLPFYVPVPDLEDPERTRASRQIRYVIAGLILAAAAGKGYFVHLYFADPDLAGRAPASVLIIPGFCLVFAIVPWFRVARWLRQTEDKLIEKKRGEAGTGGQGPEPE